MATSSDPKPVQQNHYHSYNIGSREGQDYFARKVINKSKGTFLDVGCGNPLIHNNTINLELMGWAGLGLDINIHAINNFAQHRKTIAVQADLNTSPLSILEEHSIPAWVDFLSFDIDEGTVGGVNNFPWNKYQFGAIAIEHDGFQDRLDVIKDVLIDKHSYVMFASNVCSTPGRSFEHWLIHPELKPAVKFKTLGNCPDKKWWQELCVDFLSV